jgi:hypothetical protein
MTLGQLILAVGLMQRSWSVLKLFLKMISPKKIIYLRYIRPIMWVGRIVYGLGAENFGVANSSIVADWFIGDEKNINI